ncbi:carbamoyltransferase HypF [bacterium]|nr:carbamoyltransferase HypF [candidate division CSSED10-310 bacterium]
MITRTRIQVRGAVQGVGFRPFVYRLAGDLGLKGWVQNSSAGLIIEVEGVGDGCAVFLQRLIEERPGLSRIDEVEHHAMAPAHYSDFAIIGSLDEEAKTAIMLPDAATCPACVKELFDPADRRYRYPFINCTACGPRYSIIESLPYDRPRTSMKVFIMCEECAEEYSHPENRRFHAQPNACPKCGPRLYLVDKLGRIMAERQAALGMTLGALEAGQVVAVKGLGGFHLVVDATNDRAVHELRCRKRRGEKPFALMLPDLATAGRYCRIDQVERDALCSSQAPIVLLRRRTASESGAVVSAEVAPGSPYLGIMLPYTPLHHLLLADFKRPLVATSGNLADEPICIGNDEAMHRLNHLADLFLMHDRSIVRHVDDSIVQAFRGEIMVLRRARGYAPMPVRLPGSSSNILAVGGHLKNCVALGIDRQAVISQHIGDLGSAESHAAFTQVIATLTGAYEVTPRLVVHDLHPDYESTRWAMASGIPALPVQHHYAHIRSCMAEHGLEGPLLGAAWDGAGYGPDGTVWGGEFLLIDDGGWRRVAHLRRFRLPGGERAMREPRRAALGILYELFGNDLGKMIELAPVASFTVNELDILIRMLERGVNCPLTSSAGRLFDATAALLGLRQFNRFEGQAAMSLEYLCGALAGQYPFTLRKDSSNGCLALDWEPLFRALLDDLEVESAETISGRFHATLVEMIAAVAQRLDASTVVMSGGCFQNRLLLEAAVVRLTDLGIRPVWHRQVPPNDGGIALGQLAVAAGASDASRD